MDCLFKISFVRRSCGADEFLLNLISLFSEFVVLCCDSPCVVLLGHTFVKRLSCDGDAVSDAICTCDDFQIQLKGMVYKLCHHLLALMSFQLSL